MIDKIKSTFAEIQVAVLLNFVFTAMTISNLVNFEKLLQTFLIQKITK